MNQKDFLLSPCTNFQFLPILASDSLLNSYGLPKFLSKGHTGLFSGPLKAPSSPSEAICRSLVAILESLVAIWRSLVAIWRSQVPDLRLLMAIQILQGVIQRLP